METTTFTISLPKDIGVILEDKARVRGKGVAEYVQDLVTEQIQRPTFRELFADVRENIEITDEDLAREIDAAIVESRNSQVKK